MDSSQSSTASTREGLTESNTRLSSLRGGRAREGGRARWGCKRGGRAAALAARRAAAPGCSAQCCAAWPWSGLKCWAAGPKRLAEQGREGHPPEVSVRDARGRGVGVARGDVRLQPGVQPQHLGHRLALQRGCRGRSRVWRAQSSRGGAGTISELLRRHPGLPIPPSPVSPHKAQLPTRPPRLPTLPPWPQGPPDPSPPLTCTTLCRYCWPQRQTCRRL